MKWVKISIEEYEQKVKDVNFQFGFRYTEFDLIETNNILAHVGVGLIVFSSSPQVQGRLLRHNMGMLDSIKQCYFDPEFKPNSMKLVESKNLYIHYLDYPLLFLTPRPIFDENVARNVKLNYPNDWSELNRKNARCSIDIRTRSAFFMELTVIQQNARIPIRSYLTIAEGGYSAMERHR